MARPKETYNKKQREVKKQQHLQEKKQRAEGTTILIETSDEGDHARVCVTDKGIGIPEEEQRFVFERYFRSKDSLQQKGFGLGLFICAEIIRQHRGTIGLTSTPGEGSSFYFTLPYG